MNELLKETLLGFTNITSSVRRGITHTNIRVIGDSIKFHKPGFVADVYINCRTQAVSIARIDTGDDGTLYRILGVLSKFQF